MSAASAHRSNQCVTLADSWKEHLPFDSRRLLGRRPAWPKDCTMAYRAHVTPSTQPERKWPFSPARLQTKKLHLRWCPPPSLSTQQGLLSEAARTPCTAAGATTCSMAAAA